MAIIIGVYGEEPCYELQKGVLVKYNFKDEKPRKSVFLKEEDYDRILDLYLDSISKRTSKEELIQKVSTTFDESEKLQRDERVRKKLEDGVRKYIHFYR